ncbi:6-phospho-3-hexuloisomerase [Bacillus lacus]|uniref:6-phospho-3-hexuloisomerase n=1 Tax=Metabacillus lacus TaxID=1983721 RepID=A0A7X2J2C1_9BACI|nr:6-phospho-3-hexuloisomerase [Metabacillus lacus]MRX74193.1 6-phospho-3-hexuloisomerase [Metabacillus lacus]
MNTTQYLGSILDELRISETISDSDAETLIHAVLEADKVFVAGAGRSGFMAKSFAMRLGHLGIPAHVPGETTTPGFEERDLMIIASGSGETKSLVSMAEKAKSLGGTVAAVTISPDSTIGNLADLKVKMPGAPKDQSGDSGETIQPMGSLFEQLLLLFFDALILRIMEKKGMNTKKMYGKHANLE